MGDPGDAPASFRGFVPSWLLYAGGTTTGAPEGTPLRGSAIHYFLCVLRDSALYLCFCSSAGRMPCAPTQHYIVVWYNHSVNPTEIAAGRLFFILGHLRAFRSPSKHKHSAQRHPFPRPCGHGADKKPAQNGLRGHKNAPKVRLRPVVGQKPDPPTTPSGKKPVPD